MIQTNLEKLVDLAVLGTVGQPDDRDSGAGPLSDGGAQVPLPFRGINYTVKVGDPAFGWPGGHEVGPGVAIEPEKPGSASALAVLSSIGNEALVVRAALDGRDVRLQGATGVVTGKVSPGRVLVHFPKRILDRLAVGDQVQIRASGMGLQLQDFPDVRILNLGPRFWKALNPSEKGGRLRLPVTKIVPAKLLGEGLGRANAWANDYDLQATSPEVVKELSLDQLRLGDLVALTDLDATGGPRWHPGALTVGIVVHGASRLSGHGPGINVLVTSQKPTIEPIITRKANLAELLEPEL